MTSEALIQLAGVLVPATLTLIALWRKAMNEAEQRGMAEAKRDQLAIDAQRTVQDLTTERDDLTQQLARCRTEKDDQARVIAHLTREREAES